VDLKVFWTDTALEQLENIFNRKIDLITDKSLSNPFFIKSIEKTKQLLYAG